MGDSDRNVLETQPDDIPMRTDGMSQPVFYADFIRGALLTSGVVKLNFVDVRLDALANNIAATHVVTIATPINQLRAWAQYLNSIADQNGVPPLSAESGPNNG